MNQRSTVAACSAVVLLVALACGGKKKGGDARAGASAESDTSASPGATPAPAPAESGPSYRRFKGAVFVSAQELVAEYKANEVRADGKYKGKRVVVIGAVHEIKKDITDRIYLILDREKPDPFGMQRVQAFFSDDKAAGVAALNRGNEAAVFCTCDGLMMNVLLRDCELVTDEVNQALADASARTAASSAASAVAKRPPGPPKRGKR